LDFVIFLKIRNLVKSVRAKIALTLPKYTVFSKVFAVEVVSLNHVYSKYTFFYFRTFEVQT
jgi:hypothetical protein